MITTAAHVRQMLAGLPDETPVFADIWTPRELASWVQDMREDCEEQGDRFSSTDLAGPAVLLRALECLPDAWASSGDDLAEQFIDALRDAFIVEEGKR